MNSKASLHGLACPNCGGMVPIPEGQAVVHCPYCEMRSLVRGERGLRRYQIPLQVNREAALSAMQRFLSGSFVIASNAARQARLEEAFVAYLPFWAVWARVLAWAFGEEQVGSGDDKRYEPREVKIADEMSWNGAACDVGEFGVVSVPLADQPLEPFEPEALHATGLVFEPVGSLSEAEGQARDSFRERVHALANLDRVAQIFLRTIGNRLGLVYYPLWVLRYLYRGRAYQVVVDGYSGQVLYGKAPGNTLYRAAILIGGMALGAFLAVDVSAAVFYGFINAEDSEELIFLGLAVIGAGVALMRTAYRRFRYGELYEYRSGRKGRQRVRRKERGVLRAREQKA